MSTKKGVKLDDAKMRWDLLPLELVEGIVETLTYGADKYTDNGWQEVPNGYNRYKAAMFRHLVEAERGVMVDSESKIAHLKHFLTNAMFMVHLFDRRNDDKS